MLPKGFLVGNLTTDPQNGVAQSNQNNYSRISVACNDIYVKQNASPKTHFFNCIAWGKRAQFIQNFLKKGDKVFLEFTLSTSSYTTQDGRVVKTTDLQVDNIEIISSKSGAVTQTPQENISKPKTQEISEEYKESGDSIEEDDSITWDDISIDF